ncbi:MAG: hypothetical protein K8T20_04355 [Planctomycetes bacterium]|nr:hypothetical protein [Planctomycetota bacterium]
MLRTFVVSTALALLLAGCGKAKPAPPRPAEGGHAPVGGTGTHSMGTPNTGGETDSGHKPVDIDAGKGWNPVPVPADQKNLDYTSVFHLSKIKGNIYIENLERFIIYRNDGSMGTGSSITASNVVEVKTTWELVGGGLMEKMKAASEKTDLYVRLKGKRSMEKKFGPPPGMVGEKQDWVVNVEQELWSMPEPEYFHKTTILEEDLFDDYLGVIEGNAGEMLKKWRKLQDTAEDLGWGLSDLLRDRKKRPFQPLVEAVERIVACEAEIDTKSGGLAEASAWLNVLMEWSHFPGSVTSGDQDLERTNRANDSRAAKIKQIESQFRERLKSGGLKIAPEDAARLLKTTDGTIAQKFCIFSAEAGRTEISMEVALSVFQSSEKDDWKATTLSIVKGHVSSNPKYFEEWSDEAVLKFPSRLKAAVLSFSKGTLIPTRNARSPSALPLTR